MQNNGLTFLDFAFKVLEENRLAMTPEEIWNSTAGRKLRPQLKTGGKTPLATLAARLYVDVKNASSRFVAVGSRPTRFAAKGVVLRQPQGTSGAMAAETKIPFLEKELHPLTAWFARREFSAWSLTIPHGKSVKQSKKQNQWLHPDIVGFTLLPLEWARPVAGLMQAVGIATVKLYSFELKRSLDFGTLRECFFQAVSNSSWANAGYLVVAEISETPEFLAELNRLSQSFGIGVIRLRLEDLETSEILFQAREKSELDWETINRLARLNPVFDEFLTLVRESVTVNKIVSESKYDEVKEVDTAVAYARSLLSGREKAAK